MQPASFLRLRIDNVSDELLLDGLQKSAVNSTVNIITNLFLFFLCFSFNKCVFLLLDTVTHEMFLKCVSFDHNVKKLPHTL